MSDMYVDPYLWVPLIALFIGFALSPFAKRSEVRNTLRIEAGDQLADLHAVLVETRKANDYGTFAVALQRLKLRLRAAGMPSLMIVHLSAVAHRTWHELDPDTHTPDERLTDEFFLVSEYVAMWLGTASPIYHTAYKSAMAELMREDLTSFDADDDRDTQQ